MVAIKRVLVTGAAGFIGRNLAGALAALDDVEILRFDGENTGAELQEMAKAADFIFHLAGVDCSQDVEEYDAGNRRLTEELVAYLREAGRKTPFLLSSSTEAELDHPYGRSKRGAEAAVLGYGGDTGASVFIYRLPSVFGKWCLPNDKRPVATFCHNIANDLPITIRDPGATLNLVHVDDVVDEFMGQLEGRFGPELPVAELISQKRWTPYSVYPVYPLKLGQVADLLYYFKAGRQTLAIPNVGDEFTRKLYCTYLSHLPENRFTYPLQVKAGAGGFFAEFIKTPERGQVSVHVLKPGTTTGNHWHQSRCEKLLLVSGRGVVRLRKVHGDEVLACFVSGDNPEVVDIPSGFAHHIQNLGNTELVIVLWANKPFDPGKPGTSFLEV
ncbi:NAD dependent epimerase/dehydratase family [Acididesulfobacillus acetoxydans]|uniref:NAD dependent epimerase/dehydratase family n=1 Tax=Acididesulfobacillus acetoxydans TaxID=1561005 RepID=A0A8S0X782_9FIRM|nr:NAD-dependent epimerase/dehydratase family protein [Acididesulfobacillus acetoxydans]CAA7603100.1 NAD dependent epimerase/dehydratase family [Acididesulfobacillus acetoxydans]CEJ05662.1 NAD-dependent epimerase/dehydratase [Acididesulfobacillus acetoxydans]